MIHAVTRNGFEKNVSCEFVDRLCLAWEDPKIAHREALHNLGVFGMSGWPGLIHHEDTTDTKTEVTP